MIGDIGQVYGKLTVIATEKRGKRKYSFCKCECGNEKWIRSDTLKVVKSCGCLFSQDLTGLKFGKLTAIKVIKEKKSYSNSNLWECLCECGETINVLSESLNSGRVKSCGCLSLRSAVINQKKAFKSFSDKYLIENTSIVALEAKVIPTNISGCKGVRWDKDRNKWYTEIEFQKKRYYLGRYKNKEEAIKVRKLAEENLHGKFLEWYYNTFKNKK